MKRLYVLMAVMALVAFMPAAPAAADDDDKRLQADPFEYVGKAGDCGTDYPAGSNIVTAAWLDGMGLPDGSGSERKDPRSGLLLSKNGPTADCSAAGARIKGVKGMAVGPAFWIGFDYRGGGHCGAGAPRFNVVTTLGGAETFHFVGGCANGVSTLAPQDPQWYRVRFALSDPAAAFPPVAPGSTIVSISIIFDEGTDSISAQDPMGVGLAVIDNISINGRTITDRKDSERKDSD